MRIGELSAQARVSTRALRYYEEQGILASDRTPSGQRIYPESAVDRVRLIQQLYAAGLASSMIATILPCVETGRATPELLARLSGERDRITSSIDQLSAARARLDQVIALAQHPVPEHCPALRDSGMAIGDGPRP
jgi:DNA-binding transcriptional MerR regulator